MTALSDGLEPRSVSQFNPFLPDVTYSQCLLSTTERVLTSTVTSIQIGKHHPFFVRGQQIGHRKSPRSSIR